MQQRLIKILQSCRDLRELKQIYLQILVNGLQNAIDVLPRLIDKFLVLGSLNCAVQIFETSQSLNVVAHNAMLRFFARNGHEIEVFCCYNRMRVLGVSPNDFTFTLLLNVCKPLLCLRYCEEIHAQLTKFGFGSSVFVQNVLLNVYSCTAANPAIARRVFDEMLETDVVSWNSMISAYMNHMDIEKAIELFNLMPERNIVSWNSVITALSKAGDMALARVFFDRAEMRNTITWNAILTGYVGVGDVESARKIFDRRWDKDVVSWTVMISGNANAGDMESARKLFDKMTLKNVVSWNAVIAGYTNNSRFDEALALFHSMLLDRKCSPNEPTLVSVVSAVAHLGSFERGIWISSYIEKSNFPLTITLGNALIDMFAKCGQVTYSVSVFNRMTNRCIITWTTMILGLSFNGQCREALALFDEFCKEGIDPDDVVFIAALSACTHGGFVEEGRRIFDLMVKQYDIKPRIEHYGSMVDLLGRAGRFEEAIEFILAMPVDPNVVIWATLLSCCNFCGDLEIVEYVNRKMKEFESREPGYQVLASNCSARTGGWNHVMDVRAGMSKKGIEKTPGCSSIDVGGEVHEFRAKDDTHGMMEEIYDVLEGLAFHMRQSGYIH